MVRPITMAWMNATPSTPSATARMVALESVTNSAPRPVPMMRSKIASALSGSRSAEGHDDSGDDERGQEQQDRSGDAGHRLDRGLGQGADLRLQALDERRQILVGSRPCGVNLLADDRPFGDARRGRGNHQRVVAHAVDQVVQRVAQRAHQHGGRQDDDHDAHERQQRRCKPLPSAHLSRQLLVRRIQRDRQDQRPRHQADEGRKDLVAEDRQGQHQSCPDQDVHQPLGQSRLDGAVGREGRTHGSGSSMLSGA